MLSLGYLLFSAYSVGLALGKCSPEYGAGSHLINIDVGSTTRTFVLRVPGNVTVSDGLPAVVAIHGYSANPYYYGLMAGIERFNNDQYFNEEDPTASNPHSFEYDQAGFKWLFATPFGTATTPSPLCCPSNLTAAQCESGRYLDKGNPCAWNAGSCCGTAPARKVDDVAFIKALADWMVTKMCANSDALFATGFSNGAMMTNRLGCELSGTFRAIAPFDGPIKAGGDFKGCTPDHPISVVQYCGTADSVCTGGMSSTMSTWAKANGCSLTTAETYTSATSKCTQFTGCKNGTIVEQCLILGLNHNFAGHLRPGYAAGSGFGYQPATNMDGFRYFMNRFSTLLPDSAAKAAGLPTKAEQAAAFQQFPDVVV